MRPTATTAYDPGDTIRLSFSVTASPVSTAYADADCRLLLLPPVGALRTLRSTSTGSTGIVHDATGRYHADVVPTTTEAGRWAFRFHSTGAVRQAAQGAFAVRRDWSSTG